MLIRSVSSFLIKVVRSFSIHLLNSTSIFLPSLSVTLINFILHLFVNLILLSLLPCIVSVKLSMFLLDMQNSNEEAILSQPEYAKIQKIDRQRYILDLSPEDVRQLDEIHSKTLRVEFPSEGDFFTTLEMEEHGIYLMVFEVLNELG